MFPMKLVETVWLLRTLLETVPLSLKVLRAVLSPLKVLSPVMLLGAPLKLLRAVMSPLKVLSPVMLLGTVPLPMKVETVWLALTSGEVTFDWCQLAPL